MEKEFSENLQQYLMSTFTIDSDHPEIKKKTIQLTENFATQEEKAVQLFYFVRDEIPYNLYMISVFKEDFIASRILAWGKGYCVQKAVLLTALARATGIPARLSFAKIRNHKTPKHILKERQTNIFPRHGYSQLFLNGRWVSVAPTFHKAICKKYNLPTVEFDGKNDATLPQTDLYGNPYIEYITMYPPVPDLPFDWIVEAISQVVGPDKRPLLNKVITTD